ncbi:hypothetical protein, partial [Paraburkholderia sabiae]|uniref:hypothetical protein n=1 Tax=Paraburkholderia sabiae TaxID=273251 RepID=UPI001CC671EC
GAHGRLKLDLGRLQCALALYRLLLSAPTLFLFAECIGCLCMRDMRRRCDEEHATQKGKRASAGPGRNARPSLDVRAPTGPGDPARVIVLHGGELLWR